MKASRLIYWLTFVLSSVAVVMNVLVLSQYDFASLSSQQQRSRFLHKPRNHNLNAEMERRRDPRGAGSFSYSSNPRTTDYRRSRTLIGILSADTRTDYSYRRRHRQLFQIWNDTRVCSLAELKQLPEWNRKQCQLVYTFVIGAATDPDSPTFIVNASIPLYRQDPLPSTQPDVNQDDVTLLNIKYVSIWFA